MGFNFKTLPGATGAASFCVQLPPEVLECAEGIDEKDGLELQLGIDQASAVAAAEHGVVVEDARLLLVCMF
jgi:hypothetical protein